MPHSAKPIVVTVADDMLGKIQQVADQLAAKGMRVSRVMPVTGVITGSCAAAKVPVMQKVAGVMSVEEETVAQLPPTDSPVQ